MFFLLIYIEPFVIMYFPSKFRKKCSFYIYQYDKGQHIRADLHRTALTHATSLRQAYDMTWDHLHAYDIFTYKIKYAKVCTGIYGAKKFQQT